MDPWEYAKKYSHLKHLVISAWLDLQWNIPDRSDHYLMQIAQAVSVKRGQPVTPLPSFVIQFPDDKPVQQELTDEEYEEMVRQVREERQDKFKLARP